MAVPNTDTFSLSDVISEIGTGNSLANCFTNANAFGFDPLYSGAKNSLLNFRNYSHLLTHSFMYNNTVDFTSKPIACSLGGTTNDSLWHDGASNFPESGDLIYTSAGGGVLFNGNNKFYYISYGGVYAAIQISPSGLALTDSLLC